MKVLIIGNGKTIYFLSRKFISQGHNVVIINRDKEECIQLARQLKARIICGDGSDSEILKDAGAMGADAVLAITPDDQDNLVICQLASIKFGVSRTIALANDPDNAEVFEKLGITGFSITQIVGSLIEQRASLEQITNLLPVGEGRVNVTEVIINDDSPVAGRALKDIRLPENSLVAVIIRNDMPIVPNGSNDLKPDDRIIIITLPENHGTVIKILTGERS
ncbi:MAG: TrkA family potassium uptake protein [Deltaproteobacteria bacterium]|nr:TrkA family potassium uptake protein [Deltaproteobacteria bacterium]